MLNLRLIGQSRSRRLALQYACVGDDADHQLGLDDLVGLGEQCHGIVRPSVSAVLRLTIILTFVDC